MRMLILVSILALAGCATTPEYGTTEWSDVTPECSKELQDQFMEEVFAEPDHDNPEVYEFYQQEFETDHNCQLN